MRTARSLTMVCVRGGGYLTWGGVWPRGCLTQGMSDLGGVPYDLSHHAFDVTCMLPPHQLRPTSSAAAYILLVGHVTCKACWDTKPPLPHCEQNSWHTPMKILPCPKLRLRAVITIVLFFQAKLQQQAGNWQMSEIQRMMGLKKGDKDAAGNLYSLISRNK